MPNLNDQPIPHVDYGRDPLPVLNGVVVVPEVADEAVAVALAGDVLVILRPPPMGFRKLEVLFSQDGTGGRTVTWVTPVTWTAGVPTIGAAPLARTRVSLLWDNGTWYEDASGGGGGGGSMTGAEILAALLPVDGAGSGLDADLLDGQNSSAFAPAVHSHPGGWLPAIPSGMWALTSNINGTAIPTAAGQRMWVPLLVPRTFNVNGVGINVTTLIAGSVARLGIYADSGGYPGALIADGGTVSCATIGEKIAPVTATLTGGLVVWLVTWVTGGAPSLTGVANSQNLGVPFPQPSIVLGTSVRTMYRESGLTVDAPLPATAPTLTTTERNAPIMGVRAA